MIHSEELQVTVGTKQLIEPANRGRKLNMQQHDVNQKWQKLGIHNQCLVIMMFKCDGTFANS